MTEFNVLGALAIASAASYSVAQAVRPVPAKAEPQRGALIRTGVGGTMIARSTSQKTDDAH